VYKSVEARGDSGRGEDADKKIDDNNELFYEYTAIVLCSASNRQKTPEKVHEFFVR
jgi:hypothetical protein